MGRKLRRNNHHSDWCPCRTKVISALRIRGSIEVYIQHITIRLLQLQLFLPRFKHQITRCRNLCSAMASLGVRSLAAASKVGTCFRRHICVGITNIMQFSKATRHKRLFSSSRPHGMSIINYNSQSNSCQHELSQANL